MLVLKPENGPSMVCGDHARSDYSEPLSLRRLLGVWRSVFWRHSSPVAQKSGDAAMYGAGRIDACFLGAAGWQRAQEAGAQRAL
jgi:hypothetical protein